MVKGLVKIYNGRLLVEEEERDSSLSSPENETVAG
jgi:hypothetical protein